MTCSISVFGAIIVVTAVTPAIMIAIVALSLIYYQVQVKLLGFKYHALAWCMAMLSLHWITVKIEITKHTCNSCLANTDVITVSAP